MLYSHGGGVVCGDALHDDGSGTEEGRDDPYVPAESLRLMIGEDIDWSDVLGGSVAAVLRRDDSTKGAGANPKSAAARRSVRQVAPRSSMSAAAPRKVVPVVIGGQCPAFSVPDRWPRAGVRGGGAAAGRGSSLSGGAGVARVVPSGRNSDTWVAGR